MVFDFLRKSSTGVGLLQKTYNTPDVEFPRLHELRKISIWDSGKNKTRKVAILIFNDYWCISSIQCDKDGRTIAQDINVHG